MLPSVKITTLLLVTALALTGSACGDDAPAAKPSAPSSSLVPIPVGTVEGRLVAVGGPSDAGNRVLAGKLTIKGPQGATVNAEIGSNGRFAIQLAPGEYRLTATSEVYLDGTGICVTEPAVTVLVADQTVQTDLLCQQR